MAGSGSRGAPPRAAASLPLASLLDRQVPAAPWAEGDNLPWDDPAFSQRMLAEHLSQRHDQASRRAATIDAQVRFLARQVNQEHAPQVDQGFRWNPLVKCGNYGLYGIRRCAFPSLHPSFRNGL